MVAREYRWGGLFLLHCCWLERRLCRLRPFDALHSLIGKVFALGHDPIADLDVRGATALFDLKRSWRLIVDVHRADWISNCGHEHVIVFVRVHCLQEVAIDSDGGTAIDQLCAAIVTEPYLRALFSGHQYSLTICQRHDSILCPGGRESALHLEAQICRCALITGCSYARIKEAVGQAMHADMVVADRNHRILEVSFGTHALVDSTGHNIQLCQRVCRPDTDVLVWGYRERSASPLAYHIQASP